MAAEAGVSVEKPTEEDEAEQPVGDLETAHDAGEEDAEESTNGAAANLDESEAEPETQGSRDASTD
jgi:hypothetical protein